MGHWFSTHQENTNTASSSANNHLEETELSYHAPTLHWTGGILLAAAVCTALYYYVKKNRKRWPLLTWWPQSIDLETTKGIYNWLP